MEITDNYCRYCNEPLADDGEQLCKHCKNYKQRDIREILISQDIIDNWELGESGNTGE